MFVETGRSHRSSQLLPNNEGIMCKDQIGSEVAPADLKIIMLGDSAVGKSKIIERFLADDYSFTYIVYICVDNVSSRTHRW